MVNIKLILKLLLSRFPSIFEIVYKYFSKNRSHLVSKRKNLVIEGFPRSGNTFATETIKYANNYKLYIANHLHLPAQLYLAQKYGIPTYIVIREPISSIASLLIRNSKLNAKIALYYYIEFYKTVIKYKKSVIIGNFENLIDDMEKEIKRINKKYNTNFLIFHHNNDSVKIIFDRLEKSEKNKRKDYELFMSRPSEKRKDLKNDKIYKIKKEYKLLRRAKKLYDEINKNE